MRAARLLLLVVLLGATHTTDLTAQCMLAQDSCHGSCPVLMNCMLVWPDMETCGCQDLQGNGGGCAAKLLDVSLGLTAQISNGSGGPSLFSVGNSITLTQAGAALVRVDHSAGWGGGTQDIAIPPSTISVTVRITGVDPGNPTRRNFVLTGLGAVLPSFASVALGGGQTGDNYFSVDPLRNGDGWIDLATGEFKISAYARFYNGIFQASPALVQANLGGNFNFAQNKAFVTGSASKQALATSPGTSLW